MSMDEIIPRTKIYDKFTQRSFYIYDTLAHWCMLHRLRYETVKNGTHERYIVDKRG